MDIGHLRDFIAVIESGSLTRAAARLFVSQPAVSQRMTQLESELGARLVERGPRGVVPTPAGRTLYRDAQQLVRQFDRLAEDVVNDRHSVHGPVAVGLPTTVAVHLAPALFTWTKQHYPGVHLQLFESMSGFVRELLVVGRLDLAVLYRDDAAPRPAETALYSEDLYLVGRPGTPPEPIRSAPGESGEPAGSASAGEVRLANLRGVPLVLPGERSNLRSLVDRVFAEHGSMPTIVADVDSLGAMMRIAESGEACTVLPLSSVAALRSSPELDVRRIVGPVIERHIAVCAAAEYYEPRDAVSAVRHGMVEVTTRLAEQDAWPASDSHPAPTLPSGRRRFR